jgi:hypothetical protein
VLTDASPLRAHRLAFLGCGAPARIPGSASVNGHGNAPVNPGAFVRTAVTSWAYRRVRLLEAGAHGIPGTYRPVGLLEASPLRAHRLAFLGCGAPARIPGSGGGGGPGKQPEAARILRRNGGQVVLTYSSRLRATCLVLLVCERLEAAFMMEQSGWFGRHVFGRRSMNPFGYFVETADDPCSPTPVGSARTALPSSASNGLRLLS